MDFTLFSLKIAAPARCFITDDGYLVSNYHVVKDAAKVRLLTGLRRDEVASATQAGAGLIDAKVVQVDAANDLALLKADGKFSPLPISSSRSAQLGGTWRRSVFPTSVCRGSRPRCWRRSRRRMRRCWCWFIDGRVGALRRPDAAARRPYQKSVFISVHPWLKPHFQPKSLKISPLDYPGRVSGYGGRVSEYPVRASDYAG